MSIWLIKRGAPHGSERKMGFCIIRCNPKNILAEAARLDRHLKAMKDDATSALLDDGDDTRKTYEVVLGKD